jgi:hypothetical protein
VSQEMVEKVFGRLLTDEGFRRRAEVSLAEACSEEGYSLTPDELRAIKPNDIALLDRVAIQLDKGIKRFSAQTVCWKQQRFVE